MKVHLAYGKTGLDVSLPDGAEVTLLEPTLVPGLPDEGRALRGALRSPVGSAPLRDLVAADDTVAVVFSDLTRPQPRKRMLPVLLREMSHVSRERITLINGVGTHRPNTDAELRSMLGDEIVSQYKIIQHDATEASGMVCVGKTEWGHEAWLNSVFCDASVKILTGFIEPHIFAGFSGGPKAVLPAVAGAEIILDNHSGEMLSHARATWGVTRGNPIWEEMLEVAQMVEPAFLYNVALNRNQEITGVFAGALEGAHKQGIAHVRTSAMAPASAPFDVALTTNAGYPLDLNLYQTVKGISAAAQVVRERGAILVASECWDGIPEHGNYKSLLYEVDSPQDLWDRVTVPGLRVLDQWEAFLHARLCLHADIHIYTDGLTDEQVHAAMLTPCHDIEETLAQLSATYGPRLCVLPQGPMVIPYLA